MDVFPRCARRSGARSAGVKITLWEMAPMTADLLTNPVAGEAEAAPQVPDWDGPDPRTWAEAIPGFANVMKDLQQVAEVLEAVQEPHDIMGAGPHYQSGVAFLRHMQDQLKGQAAQMVLEAFKRLP